MTAPEHLTDAELLAEPSRQAPPAILAMMVKRIRAIGFGNGALLLGLVVSRTIPVSAIALLPIVLVSFAAWMTLTWWRFTFRVEDDKLLVTQGVLNRLDLEIPLDKIQSVSLEQGLIQRLFGIVSASADTAGSDSTEFEILGIKRHKAEALKRLASRRSTGPNDHQPPAPNGMAIPSHVAPAPVIGERAETEVELASRSPRDLFILGLLGNPLLGFAVLFGSFPFLDNMFEDIDVDPVTNRAREVEFTASVIAVVIGIFAFFALVAWVLVGVKNVVVRWDERLYRTSEGLGLTAGLLNRKSQTSLISKVQAIDVRHGPLRKLFGFSMVSLSIIGSGDFAMKGLRPTELGAVRSMIGLDEVAKPQRRVSRHLVFHRLRIVGLVSAPPVAALALLDWRLMPIGLTGLVAFGIQAWRQYRNFRWALEPDRILRSQGRTFRRQDEMARVKMQHAEVSQSWYQRRRGLANLVVSNAEGDIEIPMIFLTEANEVRDELLARS